MTPSDDRLQADAFALPCVEARALATCGSTNALLLEERPAHAVLLAADEQTAGRGRRGRRWQAPAGSGAMFSVARRLRCPPLLLSGLSLAVGVAAARALRRLGARDVALKWPNDLLAREGKLGGILVETRLGSDEHLVVVGIGINCRRVDGLGARLRRRVAALDELTSSPLPRNAVIRAVAGEVLGCLDEFERQGLAAFAEAWRTMHAHEGRRLQVRLDDGRRVSGIAAGLAPGGALRLRTRTGFRDITEGRISLRPGGRA